MKNKYQLVFLNIFITVVSLYFTYVVYEEYQLSQKIKIDKYINDTIHKNKNIIKNVFITIKDEIKKDKKLFLDIHTTYTHQLRNLIIYDLDSLKKEIIKKYDLNDKEIHLFLLNKEYTITHSTYKPDIGFKLALVPDARIELDRSADGKIYQSESISIDIINSEIKSYSYSKINDNLYFEMGLINKKIHTILKSAMSKIQIMTNKKSNLYRIEQKLDGSEYYDNILAKRTTKTKEEYLNKKKKFFKNQATNDMVILANRSEEILEKHFAEYSVYYIPLIKKNNEYLKTMGDFVLELYIDRTYEKSFNEKIKIYFYLFFMFHIFFLLNIYYFTIKYYKTQLELEKKVNDNNKLLDENRIFIKAMTTQIKSPLSVIMNNFAFVENLIGEKFKHYKIQITSAINMLENSYNDLEYMTENDKHSVKKKKINLSEFLLQRIKFFETIAIAKKRDITFDIEENIDILFDESELERLIDNNLSNGIKHSFLDSTIHIKLYSDRNEIKLVFASFSNEILNKEKVFIKNYQENNSSSQSLGLGLSMVKSICDKNNVSVQLVYKDKQNIFEYTFQSFS
jgi:hypothetical protein